MSQCQEDVKAPEKIMHTFLNSNTKFSKVKICLVLTDSNQGLSFVSLLLHYKFLFIMVLNILNQNDLGVFINLQIYKAIELGILAKPLSFLKKLLKGSRTINFVMLHFVKLYGQLIFRFASVSKILQRKEFWRTKSILCVFVGRTL